MNTNNFGQSPGMQPSQHGTVQTSIGYGGPMLQGSHQIRTSHQNSSGLSSPAVNQAAMIPQTSLAQPIMANEFEGHLRTLQEGNIRDDQKVASMKELSANFNILFSSSTYAPLLDSLIKVFLKILHDTQCQFISESNTQCLRKHILEMILRTSTHEAFKPHSKDILKCMLRLITHDNEENALLAIKVVSDHSKAGKMGYISEVTQVIQHAKAILKDMTGHVCQHGSMFDLKDPGANRNLQFSIDDPVIETFLPNCFQVQTITLSKNKNIQSQDGKFTLIPRSQQSVKVIAELPMFLVLLYQHHKHSIQTECLEFLVVCIQFGYLEIPREQKESNTFSRSLADEFYNAQAKALTFTTIMGKLPAFMEVIQQHSTALINAVMCLLRNIPSDSTIARKETMLVLKFCFTADFRNKFIPHLTNIMSESLVLGTGFTSVEHLRTFMYQMLADLLHHLRNNFKFDMLAYIATVFCKVMNDCTVSCQVQTMSIRLLNSVCECMSKHEAQGDATRDVLFMILESHLVKLKAIVALHLPALQKQLGIQSDSQEPTTYKDSVWRNEQSEDTPRLLTTGPCDHLNDFERPSNKELEALAAGNLPETEKDGKKTSPEQIYLNMWTVHQPAIVVHEARNMVKYIMQTAKYCVSQMNNTKRTDVSLQMGQEKAMLERLLKYSIQSMDIFQLPFPQAGQRSQQPSSGTPRTKEEKEALESLSSLFTMVSPDVFRELFGKYMEFLVDRIHSNMALQMIVNTFLVRTDWSMKLGCSMLKYLMAKLPALSHSNEKTSLYVKLFKIIFSAIGCSQPQSSPEGELMLKPYLAELIRRSTELSLTARDPLNYFLLLRALFRSIGGGSHDILYGEFLPLLPNLLQFLNKLQMRELFLELCLTVPVRLSSLLPYLPLLMDPLVCALNGSSNLVQQGLRTLELCVDNLQPEYLYEHMTPVRGALMQGLWRVLGTSPDATAANTAFRILGKFGGSNRKMLHEAQQLTYHPYPWFDQSALCLEFPREYGGPLRAALSLSDILNMCVELMKTAMVPNDGSQSSLIVNNLRAHAMEMARSVLLVSIAPSDGCHDWNTCLLDCIKDQFKKLEEGSISSEPYRCARESDRKMYSDCICVLLIGIIVKELREKHLKFVCAVVKQLTILGILEAAGLDLLLSASDQEAPCMDSGVLVDALYTILSDSNKEFTRSGILVLSNINMVCKTALPDSSLVCRVPFMNHLMQELCRLCYGPSWFSRLGGASALQFVIVEFPVPVVRHFLNDIATSLVEVMVGLVDEISSGAVETASKALTELHRLLLTGYSLEDPDKRLVCLMELYASHTFNACNQMVALQIDVGNCLGVPFDTLVGKFKDLFKKNADEFVTEFDSLSLCAQMAGLDALCVLFSCKEKVYEFCQEKESVRRFLLSLYQIAVTDVSELLTRPCLKATENCPAHFLPPYPIAHQVQLLKSTVIKAIVACYSMLSRWGEQPSIEKLVEEFHETNVAFDEGTRLKSGSLLRVAIDALVSAPAVIAEVTHEALTKISPLPSEVLSPLVEQVMSRYTISTSEETSKETGHRLNLTDVSAISQLVRLCPELFTQHMASVLSKHVESWNQVDETHNTEELQSHPELWHSPDDVTAISMITTLFLEFKEKISDVSIVYPLFLFIAHFEEAYCHDIVLDWLPNLCSLLSHWPEESLKFLLCQSTVDQYCRRELARTVLRQPNSLALRDFLRRDSSYFQALFDHKLINANGEWEKLMERSSLAIMDRELLIMGLLDTVSREDPKWIGSAHDVVKRIKDLWNDSEFKARYMVRVPSEDEETHQICVQPIESHKYLVPRLIVDIFLRYLRHNNFDFELLFDIMIVFLGHFAVDFVYVRDYLEKEVIPVYSIEWRKKAFELMLDKFETEPEFACKDLKMVKVMQYIITPCLHWAFERYDVELILGAALKEEDGVDAEEDKTGLVVRLSAVIDSHRGKMSDGIIIIMYQLCTLLIEHAPNHIHNNLVKKQGGRLRVFMLFAWPCLQVGNHQDPTLKFTGLFYLANIIDRFTINRRIVLQVFGNLCSAYQLDNRDMVRRAVDLLTPAVPIRMEDGHKQLFVNVQKVLMEESHNMTHLQHVVMMIVRNYRVYFFVRHDLLTSLLQAVQRSLNSFAGLVEGLSARRIALDVCEMILKWELVRIQLTESIAKNIPLIEIPEVETILEQLRHNDRDPGTETEASSVSSTTSTTSRSRTTILVGAMNKEKEEQFQRPVSRETVDQAVSFLLKFGCQTPPAQQSSSSQQYIVSSIEMSKRSIALLKVALKPHVWGEIVTIRVPWIEKQLTVPTDLTSIRQDQSSQLQQTIMQAQQTLEVLTQLAATMPKVLLLQIVRPIQRAIISCLNQSQTTHFQLSRNVNSLISRLLSKTKSSITGLDELEILNQYMTKHINDQFNGFLKYSTWAQSNIIQQILSVFQLVKTICAHQPGYLDTMCLQSFVKVVDRAAREHIATTTSGNSDQRGEFRALCEVCCASLELMRPRIEFFSTENKRMICSSILLPLIEKTNQDKVLDQVIRIIETLILSHKEEHLANVGLPLVARMMPVMEKRYRLTGQTSELINAYLTLLLKIFEKQEIRTTDYGEKLEDAFYWGLMSQDCEIRDAFLNVWERETPTDAFGRLVYLLRTHDPSSFRDHFWIRHAFWLMMHALPKAKDNLSCNRNPLWECGSLWRSLETSSGLRGGERPSLGASSPAMTDLRPTDDVRDTAMEHDGVDGEKVAAVVSPLTSMLDEQKVLLREASEHDFTLSMHHITSLIFHVSDVKYLQAIWRRLFSSMWENMSDEERHIVAGCVNPFLSSGVHQGQLDSNNSVLVTWLECFAAAQPPIHVEPSILKHISIRHHAWFRGVLLLEEQTNRLPAVEGAAVSALRLQPETAEQLSVLDSLAELYSELNELDNFAAVWEQRATREETRKLVNLMPQSRFEEAQDLAVQTMGHIAEVAQNSGPTGLKISPAETQETDLFLEAYKTSCEQLLQWSTLAELSNKDSVQDARRLMQAAFHIPDWGLLRDCRDQIRACLPFSFRPQYSLFNAMLTVMNIDVAMERSPGVSAKDLTDAAMDEAMKVHILYWRNLPRVVSNAHVKILQVMNMMREVADCIEIRVALGNAQTGMNNTILAEMKALVKTWRNRNPAVSDDLLFVSNMYDWRCQINAMLYKRIDEWEHSGMTVPLLGAGGQTVLAVHSSVLCVTNQAKVAKNAGLYDIAMQLLDRLHTLPGAPLMDAHTKVCEMVKLLRAKAAHGKTPKDEKQHLLLEAFDMLHSLRVDEFHRDQLCKLYYLKAAVLSQLDRPKEADSLFCVAAQLHDTSTGYTATSNNVFKSWAHHHNNLFFTNMSISSGVQHAVPAIANYLQAAAIENEPRARKYIARIMWLSAHVVAVGATTSLDPVVKDLARSQVAFNWLHWAQQLIAEVKFRPDSSFGHILDKVAVTYPMQIFYHLRSELSVPLISNAIWNYFGCESTSMEIETEPWEKRLLEVLRISLQYRPADIKCMNVLLEAMGSQRELWAERQLRRAGTLKNSVFRWMHEQQANLTSCLLDAESMKLARDWLAELRKGYGHELIKEPELGIRNTERAHEQIEFEKRLTCEMMELLGSPVGRGHIMHFASSLVRITAQLEHAIKQLPSRLPVSICGEALARFNHRIACVEMPSDMVGVLKNGQYVSVMSRVEPWVKIMVTGGRVVRKMYIRSQAGKVAAFYLRQCEPSEAVESWHGQFLSSLNHLFLFKDRETSRRHLSFFSPAQLRLSDQCNLVEISGAVGARELVWHGEHVVQPLDVLVETLGPMGLRPDHLVLVFYEKLLAIINQYPDSPQLLQTARINVFNSMCGHSGEELISPTWLRDFLMQRYPDPTHYYQLRKQIGEHVAVRGVVEWLGPMTALNWTSALIASTTGHLFDPDVRFLPHDVAKEVPFRMSVNLYRFLGIAVRGDVVHAGQAAAHCLYREKTTAVLMRPFVLHHIHKRSPNMHPVMKCSEATKYVDRMLNKASCMHAEGAVDRFEDVGGLIKKAASPNLLAMADPVTHPWF